MFIAMMLRTIEDLVVSSLFVSNRSRPNLRFARLNFRSTSIGRYYPDRRSFSQPCCPHPSSAFQVSCRKAGCRNCCNKKCLHYCGKFDQRERAPDNARCASYNLQSLFSKQHSHCRHQRRASQFCTFRFHPQIDPAWIRTQPEILLFP